MHPSRWRSLAAIDGASPHFSRAAVAACVEVASGPFAFLNGAGPLERSGTAVGGGNGRLARSRIAHRQFNQFGVAAFSGGIASPASTFRGPRPSSCG